MLDEAGYPVLFGTTQASWGPIDLRFQLLTGEVDPGRVARVHVVPFIGAACVVVGFEHGDWGPVPLAGGCSLWRPSVAPPTSSHSRRRRRATMNPTIPTGRATRSAWRRLGRQTKGEVLQRANLAVLRDRP